MEDAGFIIGSWVLTLASVSAYAAWMLRRARRLSRNATRSELPWS